VRFVPSDLVVKLPGDVDDGDLRVPPGLVLFPNGREATRGIEGGRLAVVG